jgi:putative toxin-antitoxin system antitoxin component (TIGR02293 family)
MYNNVKWRSRIQGGVAVAKIVKAKSKVEYKRSPRASSVGRGSGIGKLYYASLLGLKASRTQELITQIKRGLAYTAWESFIRNTDFRKEDAVGLVQITARTLSRRKEEGRLQPDESDRLVRAARILGHALDLFEGDKESARGWLMTSQPALGGSTPLEYATTDVGAREVEALIGRLEHGIPA